MKLPQNVKDELIHLYNDLRDAQENWKAATDAAAARYNTVPGVVRTRVKLEATGKLAKWEETQQMVLAL